MRLFLTVSEQFLADIMSYDIVSMEVCHIPVIVDHKPLCLGTVLQHWSSFVHEILGVNNILLELEVPNGVFKSVVLKDGSIVALHDCELVLRNASNRKDSVVKVVLDCVKSDWVVCYRYFISDHLDTVVLNGSLCPLWTCTVTKETVESKSLPDKCYGGLGLYDVCDYLSTNALFDLMNRVDYTRPSELRRYAENHGYPTIEEVFGKL